ncbi:MAG: multicopper oxidase domain-containing protein [Kibdelosporangium sp.]
MARLTCVFAVAGLVTWPWAARIPWLHIPIGVPPPASDGDPMAGRNVHCGRPGGGQPRVAPGAGISRCCRAAAGPAPSAAGWQDTVDVRPYEVVAVMVRFDGYRGRYMMHCPNLEHEDMAMMANFDVT